MNYRWSIGGNVFACILFGVVATMSFPGWLAMFDALMAGACFSAAIHTIMLERLSRQLRNLGEICSILHESNVDLLTALAARDQASPTSPDDPQQPRIVH